MKTLAALQLYGLYEEISSVPCWQMCIWIHLGGLTRAFPWALFPNYFGGSGLSGSQVQPGKKELHIYLEAHGPKGQLHGLPQ